MAKVPILDELKDLLRNKIITFKEGLLAREETSAIGFVSKLKNMMCTIGGVRPRPGTAVMSDGGKSHSWFAFKTVRVAGVEMCLGVDRLRQVYCYLRWWPEVEFSVRNESFISEYHSEDTPTHRTDHIGFFRGSRFTISEDPEFVNIVNNFGDVYRISKQYFRIDTNRTEYISNARGDGIAKQLENTVPEARETTTGVSVYVSCKRADFYNIPGWTFIDVPRAEFTPPTFQQFRGNLSVAPVNAFGVIGETRDTKELSTYRSGVVSLAQGFATRNNMISGVCLGIYQRDVNVGDSEILVYYDENGAKQTTTTDQEFSYTDISITREAYIMHSSLFNKYSTVGIDDHVLFFPGEDPGLYCSSGFHEGLIALDTDSPDYKVAVSLREDYDPITLVSVDGSTIGYAYRISRLQLDLAGISFGEESQSSASPEWDPNILNGTMALGVNVPLHVSSTGNVRIVGRIGLLLQNIPGSMYRYNHQAMDVWTRYETLLTRTSLATQIFNNQYNIDYLAGRIAMEHPTWDDAVSLYIDKTDTLDVSRFAVIQEERVVALSQRTIAASASGMTKRYNPFCALTDIDLRAKARIDHGVEIPVDSRVVVGGALYCVAGPTLWRGDIDTFMLTDKIETFNNTINDVAAFGNGAVLATDEGVYSALQRVSVVTGAPPSGRVVAGNSVVFCISLSGEIFGLKPERSGDGYLYFSGQSFQAAVSDLLFSSNAPMVYIPNAIDNKGVLYIASGQSIYGVTEQGQWVYNETHDEDISHLASIDGELVTVFVDDNESDFEFADFYGGQA